MTAEPADELISRTEAQVHVALADGRAFSLAAALVRLPGAAYLLRSSLTDVERRRCATLVIGDRRVPAALRERFDREPGSRHPLVRRALGEVLATGHLPYPDATAEPSGAAPSWDFAGNRLIVRAAGGVELQLAYPGEPIACELTLVPRRPPIAHGGGSWIPR